MRSGRPSRPAQPRSCTAAVSTYAYVNPAVAVSLGALFLGERPTLATLLGGAVVVLSVAMLLIHRTESRPRARTQRGSSDGPSARIVPL